MNKSVTNLQKISNWFAVVLLLIAIIPLLVLSGFNHPSPVDDYCYIDTVFKYSWLEAMHFYYTGWTGRYFSIFLNHTNPLLFHWFGGFKVIPPVLILGTVVSIFLFFKRTLQQKSISVALTVTGSITFLYIMALPSAAEAFYWMAAFSTYTFANIFTIFWIIGVVSRYNTASQSSRKRMEWITYFFVFAIIGSSETNLLIICLLIGSWWLYRLVYDREIDSYMIITVLLATVCLLFFFLAPGNTARLGGNPLSGDIMTSAIASFRKLAQLLWNWSSQTPLLFFSVIWWLILDKTTLRTSYYLNAPIWLSLLLYIGILTAQLFPSYYGIGIEPTPRVINCVYLFFLLGWFFNIALIKSFAVKQHLGIPTRFLVVIAILALLFHARNYAVYTNNSLTVLYSDWLDGKAAAFDSEMNKRYEMILASDEGEITLPAIKNRPQSLYVGDIGDSHWWVKCTSGYFGKDVIHITD